MRFFQRSLFLEYWERWVGEDVLSRRRFEIWKLGRKELKTVRMGASIQCSQNTLGVPPWPVPYCIILWIHLESLVY